MQTLDIMAEVGKAIVTTGSATKGGEVLRTLLQLFHLVVAAGIFLVGVVEFSVEPSIFDVFGRSSEQRALIPDTVFKNATITNESLGHILDAPILILFLIYFLSVLWLKCRGMFAWLITSCQVLSIVMFVAVNAGLSQIVLDWRYFYTRAITMFLDVQILSFDWTVIVVILLHIRGWFPFKVNKKHMLVPYHKRTTTQRIVVVLWNFIALHLVLSLCLLVWFSKLYVSWACVRERGEIKLMCQFTNLVQCWPCGPDNNYCNEANITQCIHVGDTHDSVIRCIEPLYTAPEFHMAFCVFNYNIGPYTFVTVFSYVGGIYFFMRTVLNALVKCLYNILYVALHCCIKLVHIHILKKSVRDAETTSVNDDLSPDHETKPVLSTDPRVSLLGPLPYIKTAKRKD